MPDSYWQKFKNFFGVKDDDQYTLNLRRISDQAALLQNIDKISENEIYTSTLNTTDAPLIGGIDLEDSELTVNRLYNYKNFIKAFNKLTPADLSNLVPYIKLYKIYPDSHNTSPKLIPFNNFFPKKAYEQITAAGSDRGYQANIVDLQFTSQGKDTATTFIYEVKISFIFDSVATIFKEGTIYTELFNPPKKTVKEQKNIKENKTEYYQIMLDFGWEGNTEEVPEIVLNNKQLREFIEYSKNTIFLNYIKHTININEDGSVKLDITYIGSLEMESRNPVNTDVISPESTERLKNIQEQIDSIEEKIKEKDSTASIQPIMKEDDGGIEEVKIYVDGSETDKFSIEKERLDSLYKELYSLRVSSIKDFERILISRIYYQYNKVLPRLQLAYDDYMSAQKIIENYSKLSEFGKLDIPKQISQKFNNPNSPVKTQIFLNNSSIQEIPKQLWNNLLEESGGFEKINTYVIPYFTFGTLIKALSLKDNFVFLASNTYFASFSPDSGPLTPREFAKGNPDKKIFIENNLSDDKVVVYNNEIKNISILDIPIATSTFKYWFNKNFIKQNSSSITLINFLNLCVNELLPLCVRPDNSDYIPKQNIKFKFLFDKLELNSDNELLKQLEFINTYKSLQNPVSYKLKNSKYTLLEEQLSNDKKQKNVIIFYSMPNFVSRKKNTSKDIEDGIPYFFYGSSTGTINKITFREENIPFFKESNIQIQVDKKPWKPGIFIRSKYNVLIECLGTVNFRLGSMIYISPSFTGVVDVNEPIEYGIGGYFVIVSIKTNIESGKYITSLEANWVATGTGEYTDLTHKGITLVKLTKPISILEEEIKTAVAGAKQEYDKIVERERRIKL